ncbi:unnamed protein product [Rotaria sp. Silwood1]|nr:unnamed protein product [Rotaria sp. Silwood1]CAF3682605.1 unnamed protein product [Rotaria sp. Silwood1]
MFRTPRINHELCTFDKWDKGYRDFLSPLQYDKNCWNESLTFNGRPYAVKPNICNYAGECISQYRIRDGVLNCHGTTDDEDMIFEENYCTGNVGQQRFQCFNDEHKCLPLNRLGTGRADCLNSYDESWYGIGSSLRYQAICFKELTTDCHHVKEYIHQSSTSNSSNHILIANPQRQGSTNRIRFRSYCDSISDLIEHVDEMSSSCQHWICTNDQYQCRSGQCIDLDWVCDGEWDCLDASDEEAIVLIGNQSDHNNLLTKLSIHLEKCRKRYSKLPFSNICNTSFEFGCYRSGVLNPLDIEANRPCINLTQIGDGVEDCYNAYDEKNTFRANSFVGEIDASH